MFSENPIKSVHAGELLILAFPSCWLRPGTENHYLCTARGGQQWCYYMGGKSYMADLPWQFDNWF